MKNSIIGIFLVLLLTCDCAFSEDAIGKVYEPYEVKIKQGKTERKFVLMNSSYDPNCWFYAGLNPTLSEYGEPKEPDLLLLKYQKPKEGKIDKLDEGAIFKCSFDIDVGEDVLKQLKKLLPNDVDKKTARLKPISLSRLELSLMKPKSKENIKIIASDNDGLSSLHNSKILFYTILSAKDAALFDTLLNSKAGINYELTYNYSLLSEKLQQKIKVGLNKNNVVAEPTESNSDIDLRYLKSLSRNPKVKQALKSEAASNKAKSAEKMVSNVENDSLDLKSLGHKKKQITKTKLGIEEYEKYIDLFYRSKKEKFVAANGFISLNDYSNEIKTKKIVQDISYSNLKYAYLMMPTIGDKSKLNLKQITMVVKLNCKKHTYETRTLTWTEKKGWRTEDKRPATVERFDLDDIAEELDVNQIKNSEFDIKFMLDFYNDTDLTTEFKLPVINGSTPVTTPFAFADIAEFDFTCLFWDLPESDKNRLDFIELIIRDKNRNIKRIVKPEKIKGTKAVELPQTLSVVTSPKSFEKGDLRANVYFHLANGKRVSWQYNDLKLNKYYESPYFMFNDEDWRNK